jgi:hypothetical protein
VFQLDWGVGRPEAPVDGHPRRLVPRLPGHQASYRPVRMGKPLPTVEAVSGGDK